MRHPNIKAIFGLTLFAGGIACSAAAETVKGDSAKAAPLVESTCMACHGQDGNSPVPNFPKLAGQHPEYLLHELQDYKVHHRENEMMTPIVQDLSPEDMANLAVYYSAQKLVPATSTAPDLLALGKKVYFEGNSDRGLPSCDGCHELDGHGSARFPRIAGQYPEYTLEQFRLYAGGQRKFGKKVMVTVAKRITEQEAKAVAEYIASMP